MSMSMLAYPYPLNARETEALTVVLHMQLSGSCWGRMGQGASSLTGRCWSGRITIDKVPGPIVVVHVKQQGDDIQDVHMEEDHDHDEISPRADITSLDV